MRLQPLWTRSTDPFLHAACRHGPRRGTLPIPGDLDGTLREAGRCGTGRRSAARTKPIWHRHGRVRRAAPWRPCHWRAAGRAMRGRPPERGARPGTIGPRGTRSRPAPACGWASWPCCRTGSMQAPCLSRALRWWSLAARSHPVAWQLCLVGLRLAGTSPTAIRTAPRGSKAQAQGLRQPVGLPGPGPACGRKEGLSWWPSSRGQR